MSAAMNTDRELWREQSDLPADSDNYYAPSIHVTVNGGIGINVGGTVIVKSLRDWHKLASSTQKEKAMPEGNDDYCGIGEVNPDDFTPENDEVERVRRRYHVEGQTSTEGARWQIWDGERHYARFRNIADAGDAGRLCEELNALSANPAKDEEVTEAMLSAGLAALRVSGMVETPLESDALVCGDIYLAMRGAR